MRLKKTPLYVGDPLSGAGGSVSGAHLHDDVYEPIGAAAAAIASHNTAYDHDNIAHGEAAYGWGDHAAAGYLSGAHDHDETYAPLVHTHDYAASGHNHDGIYLKLSGGTLTGQLTSTVANGTAPFVITSLTKVENLNAAMLDGNAASAFAPASHNHDGVYSAAAHTHDGYYLENSSPLFHNVQIVGGYSLVLGSYSDLAFGSFASHTQWAYYDPIGGKVDLSNVTVAASAVTVGGTAVSLAGHTHDYAASGHTHDYSGSFAALNHNHSGTYSAVGHTHDYAASNHTHDYSGSFAALNHNHSGVYSAVGHTHDYAASGHNHDGVYSAAGHTHAYYGANSSPTFAATTVENLYLTAGKNFYMGWYCSLKVGSGAGTTWATNDGMNAVVNLSNVTVAASSVTVNGTAVSVSGHTHDYAASGHTHDYSGSFAALNHNHSGTYSAVGHTHSYYASGDSPSFGAISASGTIGISMSAAQWTAYFQNTKSDSLGIYTRGGGSSGSVFQFADYNGTNYMYGSGGAIYMPIVGSGAGSAYMKFGAGGIVTYDSSDARVKTNKRAAKEGLAEILRLEPKRYTIHDARMENGKIKRTGGKVEEIGLVAQDVYKVLPDVVHRPKDESKEFWNVNYAHIVPVLINAMKEEDGKVKDLVRRVVELEAEVSRLRNKAA